MHDGTQWSLSFIMDYNLQPAPLRRTYQDEIKSDIWIISLLIYTSL